MDIPAIFFSGFKLYCKEDDFMIKLTTQQLRDYVTPTTPPQSDPSIQCVVSALIGTVIANRRNAKIIDRQNDLLDMYQSILLKYMTQETGNAVPLMEGATDVNHRQKLTINGVSQWKSFSSIQELVDMVADAVKAEMKPSPPPEKHLFRDYLLDWFETYKKPRLGEGYKANYISMINKHILPAIGDKEIADVTVADVQSIMSTLKSASTGKQVKSVISMVMDAAIADELYHHPNPCKDKRIVMPSAVTKREALSSDDLRKVIELLPTMPEEYARILAMLMMTGSRRSEALGARWEDIDWEKKTIHLQRVVRFINNRPVVSDKMKTRSANRVVSL